MELRVEGFVFAAEDGRLVVRDPSGREVCSLRAADPAELSRFFGGLRRVLDREARIQQARARNAKAFAPWTEDEDRDVRARYERGQAIADIARALGRSPRAIEMRLEKLGVLGTGKLLG